MTKFEDLAGLMKADWDRRVSHDYRFWMSDGHSDDAVMWQTGERDFNIICEGLTAGNGKTLLELGCGVGRLLRSASQHYAQVIGVDVSESAISKARELLVDRPNIEFMAGNGFDLKHVETASVDTAISFAAITSVPTDIIANYLRELRRVVKPDGVVRLQVYLGKEQPVVNTDTLHLRCYPRENFERAVALAGMRVEWIKELNLPFQVSFKEIGIEAVIVSLRPEAREPAEFGDISKALLPAGEHTEIQIVGGGDRDLEYWMTVNYAKELVQQGDVERARETLEYAASFSNNATIDVRDLMDRIVAEVGREEQHGAEPSTVAPLPRAWAEQLNAAHGSAAVLEKNLRVLRDKFPEAAKKLESLVKPEDAAGLEIRASNDGPVVFIDGQCLDHAEKPRSAGAAWAKRQLKEGRVRSAKHLVVFGFGCGYHLEALAEIYEGKISVLEPNPAVFFRALQERDLERCLCALESVCFEVNDLKPAFNDDCELLLRSQTQVVALEAWNESRALFYGTRGTERLRPQIAVIGPLQGGTLPIMEYTTRALALDKQRVRQIDMRNFAAGYMAHSELISNDILRAKAQGNYVETVSNVILDSITEKPVDIVICMAQAPLSGNTLMELRKRGIITVLWFVEDYLRFTSWQALAQYYDFIFTIQRGPCIEAIKAAGCPEVHYLPTAADPFVHMPVTLTPEEKERWGSPVSFVGAGYHNRQQMFAALADLPFKIWGTEWPECRPFDRLVQDAGRRIAPEEYIKIFNATAINLNLHSSTERNGVDPYGDFLNPRTFELAAAGAFQLVDPRTLLTEVFTPGKDIVTFRDTHELKEKVAYYLAHENERRDIAAAARKTVLEKHTYQHRLKEMLSIIYSRRYEQLKRREDASPWKRMLERSKQHDELHRRCQAAFQRGEEPGLDGLVADIVTGKGSLTETEQKLLFLFHISKQIIRMKHEEMGGKPT